MLVSRTRSSEVPVTCFPTSMRQSWSRPEAHINTGRLCSAGSGRYPAPRRHRSYAALRLPPPHRPPLQSSLANGLPRCGCLFFAARPPGRAPASVSSVGDGSPALRITGFSPRRNKGLPGSWAVLFVCAVVEDPAGCKPPLAHRGEVAVAFRQSKTPGTRNDITFVAARPTRSRSYASPDVLPHPS